MKRLLTISLAIFVALAFLNMGQAQKAQKKTAAKDSPCLTDCKKENKKCADEAKKAKKDEKKGKVAACEKALKDCKANCNKPKEQAK